MHILIAVVTLVVVFGSYVWLIVTTYEWIIDMLGLGPVAGNIVSLLVVVSALFLPLGIMYIHQRIKGDEDDD